jgi:OOP family OmpA-OmpF porin
MKTSLALYAAASFAMLVAAAPPVRVARAQTSGFASNRFEPSERGSEWFVSESLDFRGALRPAAGAVFDWAYKPLVLLPKGDVQGTPRANVITDQIFLHVGGALILADRFRVGISLPVAIYQHGDELQGIAIAASSPTKGAIGDTRLTVDALIFGEYGDPIRGAVGAQVFLPTGSRTQFTGEGVVRVAPRFLIAGDYVGFMYAAKVGFGFRPEGDVFEGRPLGSDLLFSVAAGVKVNDRFVFGPELYGSTAVTGDGAFRTRDTPLEMLVGARLALGNDGQIGTAIGPGFTRGDGTPSMRVVVALEWAPDVCVDKDGDGICAYDDACPDVDGVRTNDPKTNGCPPPGDPHEGVSPTSPAPPASASPPPVVVPPPPPGADAPKKPD